MFTHKLKDGLNRLGLPVPAHLESFEAFYTLVLEANAKHNLTRISSPDEFIEKHLLDSLTLVPLLPPDTALIDIGSGAGFPGIPLALYTKELTRPADTRVTSLILVESQNKKATFLQQAIQALGLDTAQVWHTYLTPRLLLEGAREHALITADTPPQPRRAITCVSRATHAPAELLALCAPLLALTSSDVPRAQLISMQGPKSEGKIDSDLEKMLRKYPIHCHIHGPVYLPFTQATRFMYRFEANAF